MTGRGYPPRSRRNSAGKRAGLTFSVRKTHRLLKAGHYVSHISFLGSVYCTAVLEYLTSELLEIAGNFANEDKKRITPRHILLSVRGDQEFSEVLENVTIAEGGVVPNIHTVLLRRGGSIITDRLWK